MLQKIASNYLEKVAFEWGLFGSKSKDEDLDELDKVYRDMATAKPKNAVTQNDVWYADEYFEEDTPSTSIKNLKGYNHDKLVKHIQNKLLPKLLKEYKDWFPKDVKSLRLKGIKRILSDRLQNIPYEYHLSVDSKDKPDWYWNHDHDLIVYPEDPSYVSVE
jgi:hypothetical protein